MQRKQLVGYYRWRSSLVGVGADLVKAKVYELEIFI